MSDSNTPSISVLVPIFNVEKYLRQCLDSLVAQTFKDFEVICINDGSTDGSRAIIEEYVAADARFKAIHKDNSGYGASMNRGLDATIGRNIAILESDDFCKPTMLEDLLQTMEQHDAQVVKANCYYYWDEPSPHQDLHILVPPKQCGRLLSTQVEHDIFYMPPAIWAGLYSRSFLEDNKIRFTETPGASYQDTGFNFKIWLCATRVVFLKEAYLYYRQDNQNSSVKSAAKVYCVVDEYTEMERFISQRESEGVPAEPWMYAVKAKLKYHTYIWNYERLSGELQAEWIEFFAGEMQKEQELGHIDWSIFERWYRRDLESILASPAKYHQDRLAMSAGETSKMGKLRHYLKMGGLPYVAKIAVRKLFKR